MVDLCGVVFIDAAGITVLCATVADLADRGQFVVIRPSARVRRVLNIAQVGHLVDVPDRLKV